MIPVESDESEDAESVPSCRVCKEPLEEGCDDGMEFDGLFTEDGDLLGLYDGVSLYDRGDGYGVGDYPDTITIFKGPHERLGGNREETLEEVRRTVIHEVAHYFGMDEEQVDDMGYA